MAASSQVSLGRGDYDVYSECDRCFAFYMRNMPVCPNCGSIHKHPVIVRPLHDVDGNIITWERAVAD